MKGKPNSGQRILFLAKYLDSGGVTTHMMTLAQALQAKGWQVGLISGGTYGSHEQGVEWFESHGIQHFRLDYNTRNPIRLLAAAVETLKVVRQFKPDLLHVHWRITSAYAQLSKIVLRVPFVTTIHLLDIGSSRAHKLFSFWGSRSIAISSECREYLITDFQIAPEKIDTVYNGADEKYFRPATSTEKLAARTKFKIQDQTIALCLVGRLEPVKGHQLLLEAVAPLVDAGHDLVLLFAGVGGMRTEIEQSVERLGLSARVHFLGHIDSREVYWASDIMALPSYKEGFPLSVVEAMLCEMACVRTNTSGANDVFGDGQSGVIVPIGDVVALRESILQLIVESPKRQRIGQTAHARALDLFTSSQMVEKTLATYRQVLKN